MTLPIDDGSTARLQALTVSDAVAGRLREVRKSRGWTAGELADRCSRAGFAMTKSVMANIESGRPGEDGRRRRDITVDELLAFALVLDIAPIYLVGLPQELSESPGVAITPDVSVEDADQLLLWLRGDKPLPSTDARRYFTAALEQTPVLDSVRVVNELKQAVLQDRTKELLNQFQASKEQIASQARAELDSVIARITDAVAAGADAQEVLRVAQSATDDFSAQQD